MINSQETSLAGCHFLYPATLFASRKPSRVQTLLGSCVAICLYDQILKIGGMNHFMLPLWDGREQQTPKYGDIAVEMLIDKMIDMGSRQENIVAKVFGGGHQHNRNEILTIGKRNSELATQAMRKHHIRIVASSLGGINGRKIIFNTFTGVVLMKYIVQHNLYG
jgi:chemotaxis protein CheD